MSISEVGELTTMKNEIDHGHEKENVLANLKNFFTDLLADSGLNASDDSDLVGER